MDAKLQKELEKAKQLVCDWRLQESYTIWRRFYDRLPFKPEKEHADYLGMFARTLLELGKEWELGFYMEVLEKLYASNPSSILGYQLAVIYLYTEKSKHLAAKQMFEQVIQESEDKDLVIKAKLFLAYYYDYSCGDVASYAVIIDSVERSADPYLCFLTDVWRAKVLRDQKKYDEAEALLKRLICQGDMSKHWYCQFSAKNILAILYIRRGQFEEASQLVEELRSVFKGKKFKTIEIAICSLEAEIQNKKGFGEVMLRVVDDQSTLTYSNRCYALESDSNAERLLLALLKKGFLNREMIVKSLYRREYAGKADDKLVYYQIHSLRKYIQKFGLPSEAIALDGEGYRWLPKVNLEEVQS